MESYVQNLLSNPQVWIGVGHKAFTIIAIAVICAVLLKLIGQAVGLVTEKEVLSPPIVRLFHAVLRWLLWGVALLLVLQQIGIPINSVWTVISAVVAMVAIGFVAVWSVLSNLLCTVMLIIFQPFRVGDEIEIVDPAMTSGIAGTVRNINLMFTTLRSTIDQAIIDTQVPNNLFFQKLIRRKTGASTFSLEKQLFQDHSLLRADSGKEPGDSPQMDQKASR